ncbi:MAG: sigma 54-interacting transcriptional regulator [Vicinamibacterales bacterium]
MAAIGVSDAAPSDAERVVVLYLSVHGIGAHEVSADDAPTALRPDTTGTASIDAAELAARGDRAVEWQLRFYGANRVDSWPLGGGLPGTRLWVACAEARESTAAEREAFAGLTAAVAAAFTDAPAAEHELARLQRLDRAAALLPALLHVLDIREVFTRLSTAAKAVLPHDLLVLREFSDDMTTARALAVSDRGPMAGPGVPHGYPVPVIRAWEYSIVDDLAAHPIEAEAPLAGLGARSVLRLAIKFGGRTIGGLAFLSNTPAAYSSTDVAVGRRLADQVAVALSHHALAEQAADQARRGEELRAQANSLDMIDGLLTALVDSGRVADDFGRISAMAATVLRHDAAAVMVRLPDQRRARRYAAVGLPDGLPTVSDIPVDLLAFPDWTHRVIDDLAERDSTAAKELARHGFRSILQVALRHDERFAGALLFYARTPRAFAERDVPIARRIADRLALTLARDRELDAERRADEASERAARLEARVRALTDELDARTGYRRVVGESKPWRDVLTQATQVAATETTALLLGESGTGKEVVARFVHRGSPRKGGPFVALNCAALPEQLLEAELFGYERGAFTGATQSKPGQLEQAAGGTIFLDEVGEMSLPAQAKFLRVLQEREFQRLGGTRVLRADARVVAATNRDLPRAIANGQFREDLYYRLNVFAIRLPALRDRPDDILPLADAFLAEVGRGLGRPPAGISRDAREMLVAYRWPGNVRELRNILERAAILCEGGLITAEYLGLTAAPVAAAVPAATPIDGAAAAGTAVAPAVALPPAPTSAGDLASMEKTMIENALQQARFNKSRAAKALGMTRHQLYIRMRKHGLE